VTWCRRCLHREEKKEKERKKREDVLEKSTRSALLSDTEWDCAARHVFATSNQLRVGAVDDGRGCPYPSE
jgi:hypothetical protein